MWHQCSCGTKWQAGELAPSSSRSFTPGGTHKSWSVHLESVFAVWEVVSSRSLTPGRQELGGVEAV